MNLSEILSCLIYKFKNEHELKISIQEISEKFTTQRENIEDYLKDPRLVSAYTAFYLTTNFPKFESVLGWLPEEFKCAIKNSCLVDVGAGPGTFSLAFNIWRGASSFETYQIETSPLMQEQAKKLWEHFISSNKLIQTIESQEVPESFMLFGHSANEMGAELTMDYIKKISPEHVLFIEPGTKDFFKEMLQIRSDLMAMGYHQLYPCPHENECPLKNSKEDWCHQFIQVKHSPDVERLTQLVRKDRKLLPLTVAAFSKKVHSKATERVIRVFPENKFSFEWQVCTDKKLDQYQVFKRDQSKKHQKILANILAGDSVLTQELKQLPELKRVDVLEINNLPLKT